MRRKQAMRLAVVLLAGASLAACASVRPDYATRAPESAPPPAKPGLKGTQKPYQINGVWYYPQEDSNYDKKGVASWYGEAFQLKPTANGEIFDKNQVSAAHTTLPLPSLVEVTNLDNGRKLIVRVNDRGPFIDGRIIDLSQEAARQLGYAEKGLARVRVRYLGPAPALYGDDSRRYARATQPDTVRLAAAAPPPPPRQEPDVVFTSAPVRKGETIEITQSALAPLAKPKPATPTPAPPAPSAAFRVQAGAFSTEERARLAVSQIARAWPATVEAVPRNGVTLYRVMLDGLANQDEAEVVRQRIAEAGFADARVIRPF